MRRIDDIFATRKQPVSFEIFPPKGDLTLDAAHGVAASLADLVPDFISVTYSAGGSGNQQATAEVASLIHHDFDVPSVAHLTCINSTEEALTAAIDDLRRRGVSNVLALRGDVVSACDPSPFKYAKDLIMRLADEGFALERRLIPKAISSAPTSRRPSLI